jgi:hypothetical protein
MSNQYDPASPWRDEAKVALLKQMIAEGAFRSDIARALGVTDRRGSGAARRMFPRRSSRIPIRGLKPRSEIPGFGSGGMPPSLQGRRRRPRL